MHLNIPIIRIENIAINIDTLGVSLGNNPWHMANKKIWILINFMILFEYN